MLTTRMPVSNNDICLFNYILLFKHLLSSSSRKTNNSHIMRAEWEPPVFYAGLFCNNRSFLPLTNCSVFWHSGVSTHTHHQWRTTRHELEKGNYKGFSMWREPHEEITTMNNRHTVIWKMWEKYFKCSPLPFDCCLNCCWWIYLQPGPFMT